MQFVKYFVIISLLVIQYSFQDSSSSSGETQIEAGTTETSILSEELPLIDVNTPRSKLSNSYLLKTIENGREKTNLLLQKAQELEKSLRTKNRSKRSALSKVGLAKSAAKKMTSQVTAKLFKKLF